MQSHGGIAISCDQSDEVSHQRMQHFQIKDVLHLAMFDNFKKVARLTKILQDIQSYF